MIKAKYLIIFAVTAIILISTFSYTPQADTAPYNQLTDLTPQLTDPKTSSPFREQIKNSTISPTNQPTPTYDYYFDQVSTTPQPIFKESKPHGSVSAAQNITGEVWKQVANNAWQYFQPDIGVDRTTGLPGSELGWPYFTDWDLGGYIQAVIDAEKIGLIGKDGNWSANERLERVLVFLENRSLDSNGLPFWWYDAAEGEERPELTGESQTSINVADTGRLLVALNNMKSYNDAWEERINFVVLNRTRYEPMVAEVRWLFGSVRVYDYLVASGFAAFWPELANVPTSIINSVFAAQKINVSGVELPLANIVCEPLFISIFDLEQPDPRLATLTRQVYLAHEGRYKETGRFTAFSEGNTGLYTWAYEFVVLPNGETWQVHDTVGNDVVMDGAPVPPIVYTKVSFGFLALYKTDYARDMTIWLEKAMPTPRMGYVEGVDEEGRVVYHVGSFSNGLILSAARYAIQNG